MAAQGYRDGPRGATTDERRPHNADDRHRHSDDRPRAGASSRLGPSSLPGPPSPPELVASEQLPPPPVVPSQVVVKPTEPPLDRAKVCPLMLRVFTRRGGHHRLEDFARRGHEPDDEVSMYTWPDATLRELSDLVKEVLPDARQRQSRMGFALIYPDRNGRNIMRIVGQVHSSRIGDDDNKTLKQVKFQELDPDRKADMVFRVLSSKHTDVYICHVELKFPGYIF